MEFLYSVQFKVTDRAGVGYFVFAQFSLFSDSVSNF